MVIIPLCGSKIVKQKHVQCSISGMSTQNDFLKRQVDDYDSTIKTLPVVYSCEFPPFWPPS